MAGTFRGGSAKRVDKLMARFFFIVGIYLAAYLGYFLVRWAISSFKRASVVMRSYRND